MNILFLKIGLPLIPTFTGRKTEENIKVRSLRELETLTLKQWNERRDKDIGASDL